MSREYRVVATVCLLSLSLAMAEIATAQIDTLRVAPEKDFEDLYERAAASQFVVTGTVVRTEGIGERWTEELNQRIKTAQDLSVARHGTLTVIEVEKMVCREADFRARPSAISEVPKTIYIFLPRDEPQWVNGQLRESFLDGQQYLLFLVPLEEKLRDRWIKTYDLDPNRSYFRGEQHARGIVPLKAREVVLNKVTRLCEAVRPADVAQKLTALTKLQSSGDSVLEKDARQAEENLQAEKPK